MITVESVNSRKFIKDYEIKGDKLIKTFGTGEIKEIAYTKANMDKLINDIKNKLQSLIMKKNIQDLIDEFLKQQ